MPLLLMVQTINMFPISQHWSLNFFTTSARTCAFFCTGAVYVRLLLIMVRFPIFSLLPSVEHDLSISARKGICCAY